MSCYLVCGTQAQGRPNQMILMKMSQLSKISEDSKCNWWPNIAILYLVRLSFFFVTINLPITFFVHTELFVSFSIFLRSLQNHEKDLVHSNLI